METKNCPRCGRLFQYIRHPICDLCLKAEEEQFERLKEFLEEYPNATMAEVSQATEVSVRRITRYIREGRLKITHGLHGILKCNQCGREIPMGSFCPQCINQIQTEMKEARHAAVKNKYKSTGKDKMFTAERLKGKE